LALPLACLVASAAHAARGDAPSDYANSIPLTTGEGAAHYRIDLPVGVYAGVRQPDLSDLRVTNAAGEFVPYAVIGGAQQPRTEPVRYPGTVFAIHGDAGKTPQQVEVDVTQRADGSVVSVRTRAATGTSGANAAAPAAPVAYIV